MITRQTATGFIFALLPLLWGCSPSPLVKPLNVHETRIDAHFGGPFIAYGDSTIPMPLSSVNVAHGVSSDLSVFTGLHTTALAYGLIQNNTGVVYRLRSSNGKTPGISISPALNSMLDVWEWNGRLYPSLDANLYWQTHQGQLLSYLGVANWFELKQTRAHGEDQPTHWIPALHSGARWHFQHWDAGVEFKWLAPFTDNRNIVVDYKIPANHGAWGIYVSTGYRF